MGFLDNSGDILLDAVLTDTGRMRLAKGDGSFKIAKFCLADDEINYGLYDKTHASGSAYYDLEILQTPVMEAFTNNASSVKHRLISISRTNLLYLPVIKLNTNGDRADHSCGVHGASTVHVVAVDSDTETGLSATDTTAGIGVLPGETITNEDSCILVEEGLDTTEISFSYAIDSDLNESQYIVEMDNRLGSLISFTGTSVTVSYIDDDNIASYYLSSTTHGTTMINSLGTTAIDGCSIAGPRGTSLKFKVKASLELNTSQYLFEQVGDTLYYLNTLATATATTGYAEGTNEYRVIDSNIRITGATTGASINVPIRYAKKVKS